MNLLNITIIILVFYGVLLNQKAGLNRFESRRKHFCIVCCLVLSFLSAVRGTDAISDTASYIREFFEVASYDFGFIFKNFPSCFGYYFLSKLFYSVGLDVRVWFFFIALLFNIAIFKYIHNYSKEPLLSFILYVSTGVFIFSMAGMKQVLAMALCIFAYMYFEKKNNLVVSIILILIASTFHQSALFFIVILLVTKLNLCKKYNVIFIIINIVLFISGSTFLKQFVIYLAGIGNRFGHYSTDVSDVNLTAFYIQLLMTIVYFIYYKAVKKEKNVGVFYVVMLCLPTFFLTTVVSSFFRIGFYLMFFNYSLYPNVISKEQNPMTRLIIQIGSGLIFLLYFLIFSNVNYVTMWN